MKVHIFAVLSSVSVAAGLQLSSGHSSNPLPSTSTAPRTPTAQIHRSGSSTSAPPVIFAAHPVVTHRTTASQASPTTATYLHGSSSPDQGCPGYQHIVSPPYPHSYQASTVVQAPRGVRCRSCPPAPSQDQAPLLLSGTREHATPLTPRLQPQHHFSASGPRQQLQVFASSVQQPPSVGPRQQQVFASSVQQPASVQPAASSATVDDVQILLSGQRPRRLQQVVDDQTHHDQTHLEEEDECLFCLEKIEQEEEHHRHRNHNFARAGGARGRPASLLFHCPHCGATAHRECLLPWLVPAISTKTTADFSHDVHHTPGGTSISGLSLGNTGRNFESSHRCPRCTRAEILPVAGRSHFHSCGKNGNAVLGTTPIKMLNKEDESLFLDVLNLGTELLSGAEKAAVSDMSRLGAAYSAFRRAAIWWREKLQPLFEETKTTIQKEEEEKLKEVLVEMNGGSSLLVEQETSSSTPRSATLFIRSRLLLPGGNYSPASLVGGVPHFASSSTGAQHQSNYLLQPPPVGNVQAAAPAPQNRFPSPVSYCGTTTTNINDNLVTSPNMMNDINLVRTSQEVLLSRTLLVTEGKTRTKVASRLEIGPDVFARLASKCRSEIDRASRTRGLPCKNLFQFMADNIESPEQQEEAEEEVHAGLSRSEMLDIFLGPDVADKLPEVSDGTLAEQSIARSFDAILRRVYGFSLLEAASPDLRSQVTASLQTILEEQEKKPKLQTASAALQGFCGSGVLYSAVSAYHGHGGAVKVNPPTNSSSVLTGTTSRSSACACRSSFPHHHQEHVQLQVEQLCQKQLQKIEKRVGIALVEQKMRLELAEKWLIHAPAWRKYVENGGRVGNNEQSKLPTKIEDRSKVWMIAFSMAARMSREKLAKIMKKHNLRVAQGKGEQKVENHQAFSSKTKEALPLAEDSDEKQISVKGTAGASSASSLASFSRGKRAQGWTQGRGAVALTRRLPEGATPHRISKSDLKRDRRKLV
ncbi:unnamed protein product [Amoebophrya sp. A25]|nr:unnamed protein product [Amoebophrya sp. A25]|eukprot:GSA25T00003895001.1